MKQTWLVLLLGTFSLAGCYSSYGGYYYAPTPPPPIRVEARGYAPGPGYAWVDGYWGYRGGNYAWTPGRWARPPHPRSVWAPGRWERHGNRYRYHEGRWR